MRGISPTAWAHHDMVNAGSNQQLSVARQRGLDVLAVRLVRVRLVPPLVAGIVVQLARPPSLVDAVEPALHVRA